MVTQPVTILTVIWLQIHKLQEKSKTVSEMKEVVKALLKSYSSVASPGTSPVAVPTTSKAQLKQIVNSTVEEEERSRNVVVFGLREDNVSSEENILGSLNY